MVEQLETDNSVATLGTSPGEKAGWTVSKKSKKCGKGKYVWEGRCPRWKENDEQKEELRNGQEKRRKGIPEKGKRGTFWERIRDSN